MASGSSKMKSIFNRDLHFKSWQNSDKVFYLALKFQKCLELLDALLSWTMKIHEHKPVYEWRFLDQSWPRKRDIKSLETLATF